MLMVDHGKATANRHRQGVVQARTPNARHFSAVAALCAALASCGGFDASAPPSAQLTLSVAFPAGTPLTIVAYDENDQELVKLTTTAAATLPLTLPPSKDVVGLRVAAIAGQRVLKALVPRLLRGDAVELALDSKSTAAAQLVSHKLGAEGRAFSAVPESAFTQMQKQIAAGSTELTELEAAVKALLDELPLDTSPPVFNALDAKVTAELALDAAHKAAATRYLSALNAAASGLLVPIVCDASMIKVMFSVDLSGEALDGNGAKQLIRQPPKSGKVYLAVTVDDSSPVADSSGLLKSQMVPNDPDTVMFDDGTGGDEVAGDGVFTRILVLPRGMRVKYKYTNGSSGQGWTRAEEWPGNARILEVRDILSRSGQPDCLVIRRDAFGDEGTNKNHVNLHSKIKSGGGNLSFETDLGGMEPAPSTDGFISGGLLLGDIRKLPSLTPTGTPEARENGACVRCPAPLTAATDDSEPPRLLGARFLSSDRVEVAFSEAIDFRSAAVPANYTIEGPNGKTLTVQQAAATGSRVVLTVGPPDLRLRYRLSVKAVVDASANHNPIAAGAQVLIEGDYAPPQVLSVRSAPLRDLNPDSSADPTSGQVVVITFDEVLDPPSAENVANYRIVSAQGLALEVKAAVLKNGREVWLVTADQIKRRPYSLRVGPVRDLSRNPVRGADALPFYGFALFRFTFGAVVGFAFTELDGSKRGLPPGEKLYLTGTILAVARDLEGNPIGIGGRTDVTGVPAFEMRPSAEMHHGEPVYAISVLAPPASYAWKVAHGTPGEWRSPPATLVKVHKSLCTTADATGVDIDPVSLVALGIPSVDGQPRDGIDYSQAKISKTGTEKPGPFLRSAGQSNPQPTVMFKRENPDEVCTARTKDVVCPAIVVGTWRDLAAFKEGATSNDYDDGLVEVSPGRLITDSVAPRLIHANAFSSYSLILSFDERLGANSGAWRFIARNASTKEALPISIKAVGKTGDATLLPHQLWLQTPEQGLGVSYELAFEGIDDALGNRRTSPQITRFTSPDVLTPDEDTRPPAVLAVSAKTPTSLLVTFDEPLDRDSATLATNYTIETDSGTAGPTVVAAELQPGELSVVLTTGTQALAADYVLVVSAVADAASPPNALDEQRVAFKGFGDETAPRPVFVGALSATSLAVAFDEPIAAATAGAPGSYKIQGLSVVSADFGGAAIRRAAAFSPRTTTFSDRIVVLETSAMEAGKAYRFSAPGITDLSGNAVTATKDFVGVSTTPTVDVVFSYRVADNERVAGVLPPRRVSVVNLEAEREGLFILGSSVSSDGATKGNGDSTTTQLGGFPPEGQPLDGVEPQLLDNGQNGDLAAGDGIYSLRLAGVPLGTSIIFKAFAPFSIDYMNANPSNAQAAFADAPLGPSVFSDGQEYPGNENAVRILGDANGDGVVRINCLFGDEITNKKFTNAAPFVWVVDDTRWKN